MGVRPRYQPLFDLRTLARNTAPLTELLAHARGADRARITVPNEITEAWVHLLLSLVNLERPDHARRLFQDAIQLFSQGASEMVKSLSQKSLEESAAVQPLEIFSLISLKLVQHVSTVDGFQEDDIFQIYYNRLEAIVGSIFAASSCRMRDADSNMKNRRRISTSGPATEPTNGTSRWSTRNSKQRSRPYTSSLGSSKPSRP